MLSVKTNKYQTTTWVESFLASRASSETSYTLREDMSEPQSARFHRPGKSLMRPQEKKHMVNHTTASKVSSNTLASESTFFLGEVPSFWDPLGWGSFVHIKIDIRRNQHLQIDQFRSKILTKKHGWKVDWPWLWTDNHSHLENDQRFLQPGLHVLW